MAEVVALELVNPLEWSSLAVAEGWRIGRVEEASLLVLGGGEIEQLMQVVLRFAKRLGDAAVDKHGEIASVGSIVVILEPSAQVAGAASPEAVMKAAATRAWVESMALSLGPRLRVNAVVAQSSIEAWVGVRYLASSPVVTGRILGLASYPRPYVGVRSGFDLTA